MLPLQLLQLILRILTLKPLNHLHLLHLLLQLINARLRPLPLLSDLELIIPLILFPPLHIPLLLQLFHTYFFLQIRHLLIKRIDHLFT